jgi:hypothetical protein
MANGARLKGRRLQLSSCFTGTLPASWSALKSLEHLALGSGGDGESRGNLLEGTLPPEWGVAMTKLRQVSVAYNQLTGPLPRQWGAMQLAGLQLHKNQLTGTLPDSWTPLVINHLSDLSLHTNQLRGSLRPEW